MTDHPRLTAEERAEIRTKHIEAVSEINGAGLCWCRECGVKSTMPCLAICILNELEQAEQRYFTSEKFRSEDANDQQGDLEVLVKQRDRFKHKLEQAERERDRLCGCKICLCEDQAQCQGCGARFCEIHEKAAQREMRLREEFKKYATHLDHCDGYES